ncbi:MAG: 3-oxoadipate enol-lactonase, partial [Alphaproteobacteria bacterium]
HVPTLALIGAGLIAPRRAAAAALAATVPGAETGVVADAALLAHVAQPAPVAAAMMAFLERHGLE